MAVLGDASLGIGELFLERGARLVHVFDRDAGRAAEAAARHAATPHARGGRVQFSAFVDDLAVRHGAFDIAIVPDLSLMADLANTVRIAKRLVPPAGLAVFAAPNPDAERWLLPPSQAVGDAPGYYELYDLIAAEFSEVRMLGQAPFVGYTIVDFAAADPEASIDTSSLAEAEVPEWYVAVASERPLDLASYAVVEVALSDVSRATISSEPNTLPRGAVGDHAALAEAETRIAELHAENERLILEARLTMDATSERDRANDMLAMRGAELERELAEWKNRSAEMERVAAEARARADRTSHQVKDLDDELLRQRDRATRLTRELDEATKAKARSDVAVAEVRAHADAVAAEARLAAEARSRADAAAAEAAHVKQLSSETMVIDTRLAVELANMHERVRELEAALAEVGDPPTLRSLQNAQAARIVELEQREAELMVRASAAQASVDEHLGRAAQLEEELAAATSELSAATSEMGRLTIENERLAFEVREAEYRRLAADQALAMAREGSDDASASDLKVLEEHLAERGHEVARLTREIREAERVGRELLAELASRTTVEATPTPGSGGSSGGGVDRGQLARLQADASASTWRIAQLERELASRPAIPPAADARTRSLEEALVTAQREISELRFSLRGVEVSAVEVAPGDAQESAEERATP